MQHPGFGGANPGHNINLFSHNQANFQSSAALSGGIGGAGLGASAGLGGLSGGTGLDGHEARMRFAHGAQMQQDAAMNRGHDGTKGVAGQRIREVWRSNLHQEMDLLRSLVEQYPYISMVSGPRFLYLLDFFWRRYTSQLLTGSRQRIQSAIARFGLFCWLLRIVRHGIHGVLDEFSQALVTYLTDSCYRIPSFLV